MNTKVKYGLIAAAGGILISLMIYVAGMDKTDAGQYLNWLSAIVLIIAMVFAIKERREKEFGGFISFKTAFGTTAVITIIATFISSVYSYIYMSIINPGMKDYIMQKQLEKMEGQGMSTEQIESAMKMTESWMTPGMMTIWSLVMGLFFGIILALIVSAIMKKPNPNEIS